MGTMLQAARSDGGRFRRPGLEGCNENLVRTRPDVIAGYPSRLSTQPAPISSRPIASAAPSWCWPNTGWRTSLRAELRGGETGAPGGGRVFDTRPSRALSRVRWGPTTKAITSPAASHFAQLVDNLLRAGRGLWSMAASDILLIETCHDTRNVKAGAARDRAARARDRASRIPTMVSGTIEPWAPCSPARPPTHSTPPSRMPICSRIGLNCATGPELMTDHIRTVIEIAPTRVSCYPNAGLPNEEGKYLETPTSLAAQLERFVDNGWINIVGGCCGTTAAHIQRHRADGGRQDAARSEGARAPRLLLRHRACRSRRQQPAADRRRAHQRHRLAAVQEHGGRRKVGRGHARSRAGR